MNAKILMSLVAVSTIIIFYIGSYLLARYWKKTLKPRELTAEEVAEKKTKFIQELKEYWRPWRYNIAYALQYLGQGFVRMAFVFFLPLYLAKKLGYPEAAIPALIATILLAWALKWPWGILTDAVPIGRFGRRKPYIIIFNIICIVALLAFAFSTLNPITTIVFSIIFLSLLAAIDAAYDGLLLDITPPDYHGFTIGGVAWGFKAVGELIGSLSIGYAISIYGFSAAFLLSVVFQLLTFSCVLIHEPALTAERRVTKIGFARLFTEKYLWLAFLAISLPSYLAFYSPTAGALGFVLKNILGAAALIGVIGAIDRGAVIVGSLVGGYAADKFGHKKVYLIVAPLMGITIGSWVFVKPGLTSLLYILAVAMGLLEGFNVSSLFGILGDMVPPYLPGTNYQVFMSAGHIGAIIMLFLWSYLLTYYSWTLGIIAIAVLGIIQLIPIYFLKPYAEAKAIKV